MEFQGPISNIKEVKKICAAKHLKFFGYNLPGMADHENIIKTYKSVKAYKEWYESSWIARIFRFWYKKPDLCKFYVLEMQNRYIKYAGNTIK